MNSETANKINSAMVNLHLYGEGILGVSDELVAEKVKFLNKFKLKELLEAVEIVSEENHNAEKEQARTGGIGTIKTICADRLVSAIYTALNYESCPIEDKQIKPMFCFAEKGRQINLCLISQEK